MGAVQITPVRHAGLTGKQWFGIILSVFGVIALINGIIGISILIEHGGHARDPSAVPIVIGITIGALTATIGGFSLARSKGRKVMDNPTQEEHTQHKIEELEREIEELKKGQK